MSQLAFLFSKLSPAKRPAATPALEPTRRRLLSELQLHLHQPVAIVWTTNRHSMITVRRTRLGFHFRMHQIFADAGPEIVAAMARLASGGDRQSSALLDHYIEANASHIRLAAVPSAVQAQGKIHDLREMFERLNRVYFDGAVDSRITWGRASALRRRTIKLGSYHGNERLIRIHPALDQAFVPAFFVEFVIFHEMLHEHLGTGDGPRRCVHPPEFRALEARFPRAGEALRWERDHIHKLLRYKPD
jgi:hypothetical protein